MGPRWLRRALFAAASLFIAIIFLSAMRSRLVHRVVLAPLLFFAETARLFPYAAERVIEYRVEGFVCSKSRFVELDPRPYFPIRADDKESRFHRVGFFYRHNKKTLYALEDYLIARVNASAPPAKRIGAIRFLSLRLPLPAPGSEAVRFVRRPLAEIPQRFQKQWYVTPPARRAKACNKALAKGAAAKAR